MMRLRFSVGRLGLVGAGVASLALAACIEKPRELTEADVAAAEQEYAARQNAEADTGEASDEPAAPVFSSVYTTIAQADCETVEVSDEGGFSTQRCDGLGGMDVYVVDADGRMTVSAGMAPDHLVSWTPFNTAGQTVEWRLKDRVPVALIYRLQSAVPPEDFPETGRLVVPTLPSDGASGCAAYVVPDGVENQNEVARVLADALPETHDCSKEPVVYTDQEE